MPRPLVPDEDLYARLEVAVDASPEAIELAWRALLKRHHPDIAGEDAASLERAKRINVAHDWLGDPVLRERYDRERPGSTGGRTGVRHGHPPRRAAWPPRPDAPPQAARAPRASPSRPDLFRGDPSTVLARFLSRVDRLTQDELDRMAEAEPPPIAFLATIRRFIAPDATSAFAAVEASLAARVPHERWAVASVREGLLGVAAELVLGPFLDDMLAEPFRGRARERLLRAWHVSVDQPRYGPNGSDVVALRARVRALTAVQVVTLIRRSHGIAGDDRPWPAALSREEDEALRISAVLAARDIAAAMPLTGLSRPAATRGRRLLARLGHVVALRHAFPRAAYTALLAPFAEATGASDTRPVPPPGVSRTR
jgi:hypothetical protein